MQGCGVSLKLIHVIKLRNRLVERELNKSLIPTSHQWIKLDIHHSAKHALLLMHKICENDVIVKHLFNFIPPA